MFTRSTQTSICFVSIQPFVRPPTDSIMIYVTLFGESSNCVYVYIFLSTHQRQGQNKKGQRRAGLNQISRTVRWFMCFHVKFRISQAQLKAVSAVWRTYVLRASGKVLLGFRALYRRYIGEETRRQQRPGRGARVTPVSRTIRNIYTELSESLYLNYSFCKKRLSLEPVNIF